MDKNESIEKMDINIKIENVGGIGSEKDSSYAITIDNVKFQKMLFVFNAINDGDIRPSTLLIDYEGRVKILPRPIFSTKNSSYAEF